MKCQLCKSKTEILYDKMQDLSYDCPGNFDMQRCPDCALEFIAPPKNLEDYYPKEYYSYNKQNLLSKWYHSLSAWYYSTKSPLKYLLSPIKPLLHTYFFQGDTLLEIGCGDGRFLDIYRHHGVNAKGYDKYSKYNSFPRGKFDIIILKDTIEHLPNPKRLLQKIYSILNDDGILVITTINTDSLWRKIFGRYWFGYDVPRHINNFNRNNIEMLLDKVGFKSVIIRVYDIGYIPAGSIKFYFKSDMARRIIYNSITKVLFTPVSLVVTWMNQGSLMEVIATK